MKTLILGAVIVDIVIKVPNYPKRGGDIYASSETMMAGGCAYNIANIMQSLKAEYDLFVPIGVGPYSSIIKKTLIERNHKIIIQDTTKDCGHCYTILEKGGERSFITIKGIESEFKNEWLKLINVEKYKNIIVDGYTLSSDAVEPIVKFLKSNKDKNIWFTPGPMINVIEKEYFDDIMELHPITHLNLQEALDYTKTKDCETALKNLYKLSKNTVIITMGDQGCAYYDGMNIVKIPANKVKIIDTTGAGDSHIATIVSEISKVDNLKIACEKANLVSSKIVAIDGVTCDDANFFKEIL